MDNIDTTPFETPRSTRGFILNLVFGRHRPETPIRRGIITGMARTAHRNSEPQIPAAIIARVARGERVVVRRGRSAVAIVISPAELKMLEADAGIGSVRPTKTEIASIREARREIHEKGTIPWERVKRPIGTKSS